MVKFVYNLLICKRIHLRPYCRWLACIGVGNLPVDEAHQPVAQVNRADGEQIELRRFDIASDIVEHLSGIAPGARVGCEKAEVSIDAGGDGMIVAGAEVAICLETARFAPDDDRNLGVRLPFDKAIDDLHA